MLGAVQHPLAVFEHGPRIHIGFGHVVGQPSVRRTSGFRYGVGHQKGRIINDLGKPFFLNSFRRIGSHQDRQFPGLDQLVGKAAIPPRQFHRHQRTHQRFGTGIDFDAAVFLGNADAANAEIFNGFEDFPGNPVFGRRGPFPVRVFLDERFDYVIDKVMYALPKNLMLFGKTFNRHIHRIAPLLIQTSEKIFDNFSMVRFSRSASVI